MSNLLLDFYTNEKGEVITQAQEIINAYSSFNGTITHLRSRTKYVYNEDAGDFIGISQSPIRLIRMNTILLLKHWLFI